MVNNRLKKERLFCKERQRWYFVRPSGKRLFLCPHKRVPGRCNDETCTKRKFMKPKQQIKCPCGSGITNQNCKCGLGGNLRCKNTGLVRSICRCGAVGCGYSRCKNTGLFRDICRCESDECGKSFCKCGRQYRRCKECNPIGHIIDNVRCRTYKALKGMLKTESTLNILGIKAPGYIRYIESKFQEGMNMNNHGDVWEIGHRVPIYYNNPSYEQIIERLHYTNTFPQWKEDNSNQGNRFIFTKY